MKKSLRILAIIAIVAILGIGIGIFANYWIVEEASPFVHNTISEIPNSQAAMVLGSMVYKNGTLSPVTSDRADAAIELYKAGKVKKILVSGDHGHNGYDEVNTIRNYILKAGISPQDVFMDHAGFDTYSSMYRARDIFKIKTLVICTQQFHQDRAVFLARSMGIDAVGLISGKESYGRRANVFNETREKGARIKAYFAGKITHPKPHFLGDSIPITGDGRQTEDKK